MKKKPQIHIGRFEDRTCRITVTETPQAVIFEYWFSKMAPWKHQESLVAFTRWAWEIIYTYNSDPRPSIARAPQIQQEVIIIAPPDGPNATPFG